jgi:hypothetical protein
MEMEKMGIEQDDLDKILEEYAVSEPQPDFKSLAKWIQQYPQFERELTEFTARWGLLKWLPDPPEGDEADEERLLLLGMSKVQSVLYRRQQSRADVSRAANRSQLPPIKEGMIDSILAEAKRLGMSADDLADHVGLSAVLIRKIDRRLITSTSIPSDVRRELASCLHREVEDIVAYTERPAKLAMWALYRSERSPEISKDQEDFFDAVKNDPTLTKDRRERLLVLGQ